MDDPNYWRLFMPDRDTRTQRPAIRRLNKAKTLFFQEILSAVDAISIPQVSLDGWLLAVVVGHHVAADIVTYVLVSREFATYVAIPLTALFILPMVMFNVGTVPGPQGATHVYVPSGICVVLKRAAGEDCEAKDHC